MVSLADGRFELHRKVGEGGLGVVYEARDRSTDRRVAVKLVQELGRVAEGRLEREASLLADVLAMLTVSEVLTLAQRVVSGLALAEQRGIVHRDIKPANLFLVGSDVAATKILDLGLARRVQDARAQSLTHTGNIVGTPRRVRARRASRRWPIRSS